MCLDWWHQGPFDWVGPPQTLMGWWYPINSAPLGLGNPKLANYDCNPKVGQIIILGHIYINAMLPNFHLSHVNPSSGGRRGNPWRYHHPQFVSNRNFKFFSFDTFFQDNLTLYFVAEINLVVWLVGCCFRYFFQRGMLEPWPWLFLCGCWFRHCKLVRNESLLGVRFEYSIFCYA